MSAMNITELRPGEFFFIKGQKNPCMMLKGSYIDMSTREIYAFDMEIPVTIRRTFQSDLMKKYRMNKLQFEAWVEHVKRKVV